MKWSNRENNMWYKSAFNEECGQQSGLSKHVKLPSLFHEKIQLNMRSESSELFFD